MYEYLNLNPKGKLVGDCVKRAIAKATGNPYHDVSLGLNRHKKITGAKSFNSDYNWLSYIEKVCNGKKLSFPSVKGEPRMNGKRFCDAYPKGRYVLQMANHLTACVDGIIYDTWDCSYKCVYRAWKVG